MKLFTSAIDKQLFAQYKYGSDLSQQKVIAKIFNPYSKGTWYLLNSDPNDPDYIWAIVDLIDIEMGSVSRSELESIKVPPFRLPLERDISFTPINALQLYKVLKQGKHYANGGTTNFNADVEIVENKIGKNYIFPKDSNPDTMGIEFAKGGNIKSFRKDEAYRLTPYNSIERRIMDRVPNEKEYKLAGNFYVKGHNNDAYIYFLDEFDRDYVKDVEIKPNERIYRYITRNSAIGGMMPLVKINLENGLVYYPIFKDEDVLVGFDSKGQKTEYLNLVEVDESDYYAKGGYMAEGGETEEGVDLFEDYDKIPANVQKILDKNSVAFEDGDYRDLEKAVKELEKIGYTFEYGLDGQAYDLRKIGQKGKSELDNDKYAEGGQVGGLTADEAIYLYVKKALVQKAREKYLKPAGLWNTPKMKEVEQSLVKKGYLNGAGAINETGKNKAREVDASVDKFISREYISSLNTKATYLELLEKFQGNDKMAKGGYMEKGGITGDVHSLTDKLLSQKIQIFIDKVKPIKYYYIDEKSNSLVVGLDENYTQDAADKFHKEAISSMEFFDADSVDMEYMPKTKDTQYSIKLKKPVKFAKGGYMAKGSVTDFGDFYEWSGKEVKKKFGSNFDEGFPIVEFVKYSKNKEVENASGVLENGKTVVFNVDSVEWELSDKMAKGGEIKPYIIWVSKDGDKREIYGTYKSQRAAEMKMNKIWESGEYNSIGSKPKEMYEKEGIYSKGGVTFAEKVKSIKSSLLKRKKVSPKVQKDYGKTYSPKEAEDSAKRIVGAMMKKREMK